MHRVIAGICVLAGVAHAGPERLEVGQAAAELELSANLHPSQIANPWALAPDVWYGASDEVTLGFVHAGPELDRFQPGYQGGAIDVLWWLGPIAPRVRVLVRDTAPWKPAVALGAFARWRRGRWTLSADPYLQLGLANTDLGNRAELWLPVAATLRPAERWALDVRTGWNSDVAVITDGGWHVPLWFGARAEVTAHVELGLAVGFYTLLGPQNDGNERALFATIAWRS